MLTTSLDGAASIALRLRAERADHEHTRELLNVCNRELLTARAEIVQDSEALIAARAESDELRADLEAARQELHRLRARREAA